MKEILYSDFELDEYQARIRRARAAMDESGLDALVVSDPDNMRYLFGFQSALQLSTNRSFVGVLPRDKIEQSALFLPHDCQDAPQSWVENIHFWDEGHDPPFDDRMADMGKVYDLIRSLGVDDGRIGIELGPGTRPGMPIAYFDQLRSLLSNATLCDMSGLMWSLRKIKSEPEIELLRRVGCIARNAFNQAIDSLREGVTEGQLSRQIASEMLAQGCDKLGFLCVLFGVDGWTRANMEATDQRALRRNEWVCIDGGGVLKGYNADILRMGILGEPTDHQRRIHDAVKEAQRAIIDAIRPGVPCADAHRVAKAQLDRRRLGGILGSLSVGHGLGLNVHEMPDLNLNNPEPLQEGMVLCIEPWCLERSPSGGVFNLEDTIVVRSDGAQLLTADAH